MTAMFPDSGVPAADAKNSLPDPNTVNCNELWYSTSRCQPRFDPAAANAELAELINLINQGEVAYNCASLSQVQLAVRYLIQRGLPTGAIASGLNNATANLDPAATRYNDFMTLCVVPDTTNTGPVQLALNALGFQPVLRNDNLNLEKGDWISGRPYLISYYNGAWHIPYHVASQVPVLLLHDIDTWVRTDGNDATADGTSNDPEHAFRTIQFCWASLLRKYMPSPFAVINIRLGIPGVYEPAQLGPYGGRVALRGDPNNAAGYQIAMYPGAYNFCLDINGIPLYLEGLTFLMDKGEAAPSAMCCRVTNGAAVTSFNIRFDITAAHSNHLGVIMQMTYASTWGMWGGFDILGNGQEVNIPINLYQLGSFSTLGNQPYGALTCTNLKFGAFFLASELSTVSFFGGTNVSHSGCIGQKYNINLNSTLRIVGKDLPGDAAGITSTGGQVL
jgi:hypothetical protein